MNFFEKIVLALSAEMPKQQGPFMPFHFIMLAVIIALTVFTCLKFKNCSDKTFRLILLIVWIVLFLFEIYKQIVSPFSVDANGNAVWDYNFNDIPFQFCSSIHYVLLPIVFLKEGKVRDAFISFTMTFVFLAGAMVSIFPAQLADDQAIGICIQTMIHHGLQVLVGAFIAVRMRNKYSIKFFLSGTIVFGVFLVVALILNASLSPSVTKGEVINFFYISPYYGCSLPILSVIREMVPWPVFLIIYCIGFIVISFIIYWVYVGIRQLSRLITKKKQIKQ